MIIRIRLTDHTVGGESCPIPLLILEVRDRIGEWAKIAFKVDTGADITSFPIRLAQLESIPFEKSQPGVAGGLVGRTDKFRDRLRLRLGGREYAWPCDFINVPADPRFAIQPERTPVLGRAGLLNEFAVALDDGYLILTRLGPIRRQLRRLRNWFWERFGLIHDPEQPA